MNNRSGIVIFFLFLFLTVIVVFQILGMMQSDRLYERVNRLESVVKSARLNTIPQTAQEPNSLDKSAYSANAGDWLVYAFTAEPASLNPLTSKDYYSTVVLSWVFQTFLEYDPDTLKLRPVLAESYAVSDDGLKITFKLKEGVHFSDGQSITADDVIFSYQTLINPGVDAANLANYYMNVKDVTKVDDRTVKFEMKEPYFKALEVAGTLPIIPKHIYKFSDPAEFNRHISNPIGSGPYIFEKWDVGREIVLRRNENYWDKPIAFNKLVFRIITNDVAAIQALRAHEIDFLEPPNPEQYAILSVDKEFRKEFYCLSYYSPGGGYRYIGWNMNNPIFKDRRVRLAMTYATDREKIGKYIFKDLCQIITGPFYIHGPQNDPNIKPYPFDLEKAKQLLNEAGWKDTNGDGILYKEGKPFRFKLMIVSGLTFQEQIAKLFKDDAAKIGIDVVLDPYEWSIFIERLNNRQFEAMIGAWSGAVEEDPYQIWHSSQIAGRGSNHVAFNNPEADKLIEEARHTLDADKRNELYHKFAMILHEEQPYTFLFTRPELRFLDKRFQNVKIHKLGLDERDWYVPKDLQRYK